MPNLLRKNSSSLRENLIRSLLAVNDQGQLTYLINELKEREINGWAAVFCFITLCFDCHPELINHPKRQKLEKLYDACFANTSPQELFEILNKPENNKIHESLSSFIQHLIESGQPPSRQNPLLTKSLLDNYIEFTIEQAGQPQSQKIPHKIALYLLHDFRRFIVEKEKAVKGEKRPPPRPRNGA